MLDSASSFVEHALIVFITIIQPTLSRMLPEDVWHEVLQYVDPGEYAALARHAAGVSREFYWLLKNSLTTICVHGPVVPLCGLAWLHSRDAHFSRIKCVEGELSLHCTFRFCFLLSLSLSPRDTDLSLLVLIVLACSCVSCQGGGAASNLSLCRVCQEASHQSDSSPQLRGVF